MDNKAIAGILYETADLLEIDGQIPSASAPTATRLRRSKPSRSRSQT